MFRNETDLLLLLSLLLIGVTLIIVTYLILKSPFNYPYFTHSFNITSKRNVKIEDYIDTFLCDPRNWNALQKHEQKTLYWKEKCENYIQNCKLRKFRTQQYQDALDDKHAYCFKTFRNQTRYRQKNYVKTSYKVPVYGSQKSVNWQWLTERHTQLEKTGFETTLSEYNSKCQRKLMTPALRKKIMERDNYTCQNCGKFMPDEVGLQIDHIIPIAKGGKSISSNLRVLCSKCNGSKGAK